MWKSSSTWRKLLLFLNGFTTVILIRLESLVVLVENVVLLYFDVFLQTFPSVVAYEDYHLEMQSRTILVESFQVFKGFGSGVRSG